MEWLDADRPCLSYISVRGWHLASFLVRLAVGQGHVEDVLVYARCATLDYFVSAGTCGEWISLLSPVYSAHLWRAAALRGLPIDCKCPLPVGPWRQKQNCDPHRRSDRLLDHHALDTRPGIRTADARYSTAG